MPDINKEQPEAKMDSTVQIQAIAGTAAEAYKAPSPEAFNKTNTSGLDGDGFGIDEQLQPPSPQSQPPESSGIQAPSSPRKTEAPLAKERDENTR